MLGVTSFVGYALMAALTYLVYLSFGYISSLRRIRAAMYQWPGLPDHWLFGNVRQQPMSDPKIRASSSEAGLAFWRDMNVRFPRGYRWFSGLFGPGLVANHPDLMRAVMKGKDPKPLQPLMPSYRFLLPWLGNGLLISKEGTWLRNRRLITHAFHFDVLKTYMGIYNSATEILLGKMSEQAASGDSFEVTRNVSLCTLDILLKCAFGYEANCQTTGDNHPYVVAVNELALTITDRFFTPFLYADFIFERTSKGKRHFENTKFVHKVSDEVIKQRRVQLEKMRDPEPMDTEQKHLDFLGILLAARDEDGKGLTDLQIRNEVDTFLFEGHDTTAGGLTWMLYAMAKYPEHQKKVQEEIDEVLEGRDSDEILWEDLGKFKYMVQCLKESMRVHPPVPFIQRMIEEEDIRVGDKLIPIGTLVELNIYSLHHNPAVWPDPMEFIPDRFSPENVKKMDPFAYVPFSAGPRNCIGQNFALNEEKVILARVLRRFHIELDPDHEVMPSVQMILKTKGDIKIKLTPRL